MSAAQVEHFFKSAFSKINQSIQAEQFDILLQVRTRVL